MTPADFIRRIATHARSAEHRIRDPASADDIAQFLACRPPLPPEMLALWSLSDGVDLWLIGDVGYFGLLPLCAFAPARAQLFAGMDEPPLIDDFRDSLVSFSFHRDGTQFVAVDVQSGSYFDVDAIAGVTEIARSFDATMDWIWHAWIEAMERLDAD